MCARQLLKLQKQKTEKKKEEETTRNQIAVFVCALCCGLVMGDDDDRRNWRDSCCPLDVTTATNVLAHISTRFPFLTTQTKTCMHPQSCHFIVLLCIYSCMYVFKVQM